MNGSNGVNGCEPVFFSRLLQDVKVLENVCFILHKTNRDGFLRRLSNTLSELLDHELRFAMRELLAYDQRIQTGDIKKQLVNNTFIFKENLKNITGCPSEMISRRNLEGANTGRGTGRPGGGGGPGEPRRQSGTDRRNQGRGK